MKITAGKGKVVSQESQRQTDDHRYTGEIDRLRSQIYRQRQTQAEIDAGRSQIYRQRQTQAEIDAGRSQIYRQR